MPYYIKRKPKAGDKGGGEHKPTTPQRRPRLVGRCSDSTRCLAYTYGSVIARRMGLRLFVAYRVGELRALSMLIVATTIHVATWLLVLMKTTAMPNALIATALVPTTLLPTGLTLCIRLACSALPCLVLKARAYASGRCGNLRS